jgi:ADP-heptose:LPS heptosyltransferase
LLANTSCSDKARALLAQYIDGEPVAEEAIDSLRECSGEFFGIVVEGLADRFDPRLCDAYVDVFTRIFTRDSEERSRLKQRYASIRVPQPVDGDPSDVVVLSRVTLGADVVITSRFLDGAKKRFPEARIHLAGSRKAWELFQQDARILHLPLTYPRSGTFEERLAPWHQLRDSLPRGALVLDPDSRITQLGVLPLGEFYRFFESRAYGGDSDRTLAELSARWIEQVLGVTADSYVALPPPPFTGKRPLVSVSLGVGENPAKRVAAEFERLLIDELSGRGANIAIDRGAGGEEAERVRAAVQDHNVYVWDGAFAPFASIIASSDLYIGYDSAGQHVAAACGVPLVTVFAGYPCQRMFERWKPTGKGAVEIVQVQPGEDWRVTLDQTRHALDRLAIL